MRTFWILFLAAAALQGADNSGTASLIEKGNEAFYNLDYDSATAFYEQAVAAEPDNPKFHNHLAQALLTKEMFRNGALESELVSGNNSFIRRPKLEPPPEVEKRFFAEVDRAVALGQARLAQHTRGK